MIIVMCVFDHMWAIRTKLIRLLWFQNCLVSIYDLASRDYVSWISRCLGAEVWTGNCASGTAIPAKKLGEPLSPAYVGQFLIFLAASFRLTNLRVPRNKVDTSANA